MKYCSRCGEKVDENAKFCQSCGCSLENHNTDNNNTDNNTNNENKNPSFNLNISKDSINLLLLILGVFVPIVGLVLYIVYKDSDPEKAKSAGKGAIIGVLISVGLSILTVLFTFGFDVLLGSLFRFIFSQIN